MTFSQLAHRRRWDHFLQLHETTLMRYPQDRGIATVLEHTQGNGVVACGERNLQVIQPNSSEYSQRTFGSNVNCIRVVPQ